jgi:drug/metabolite transporter (DMT)-like permease
MLASLSLESGWVSIVSALELPVSVMMLAYVLLNAEWNATQWFGIVLIITAIVMNINFKKNKQSWTRNGTIANVFKVNIYFSKNKTKT